jgi:biopolymer transport protein ExbD
MAFSMGSGGGFSRRRRGNGGALAEINIVPLVDVVLVLLVIFMLTAHVMEFGLEIDVPRVRQVKDSTQELPVVSISKSGELYLNDKQINIALVAAEVKRRFPANKEVYLRCDRETIYDPIAQVVSALGQAGLGVKLVTQPDDSGGKK